MSENMESRDTNEAVESTDRRDTESQRLQDATAAPEALLEQGQTFQQAEAVEQELKRVVDTAVQASSDEQISAIPIILQDPNAPENGEVSATLITPPGEGGPASRSQTSGDMPDPRELDVQLPQLSTEGRQQDHQDDMPSDHQDLLPQDGKIEGNEDPHSMPPAQEQELPGGFDPGMDFGSRENMNADAAPDKFETPPGIEGPFIPGKGPGAGMEMDEEKIGIFTKFQIEILNLIQTGDEAAIAKKEAEMQERALDIMEGDQAYQKEQEKLKDTGKAKPGGGTAQTGGQSQGSKPASGSKTPPAPPPKKGGAASDSETGRIRGYVAAESLGRMDQSTDDNLISQSSPDDIQPGGAEGGHLNAYGQAKMEASAHFREEIAGKQPEMKSEWITDPVEIERGMQNMQTGKHARKQEN